MGKCPVISDAVIYLLCMIGKGLVFIQISYVGGGGVGGGYFAYNRHG